VLSGYRELIAFGAIAAVLVAVAIVLPRLSAGITVSRRLRRPMVQRGDPIEATVTIEAGDHTTSPVVLTDTIGRQDVSVLVPGLPAGERHVTTYQWFGVPRGVHQVGPVVEERSDPFGLTNRSVEHGLVDQVLVHPVIHRLGDAAAIVAVQQKATPFRSVSDDPMADFRTLRDYQPGDDPRLIHWPSTARTGQLVVRDFLDLRQTARLVVLETADSCHTPDEFEDAIEIAASLAILFLSSRSISVARTTDIANPGRDVPLRHRDEVLELFSRVRHTRGDDTLDGRNVVTGRAVTGSIHLVTGERSLVLPRLLGSASIRSRLSVTRVVSGGRTAPRLSVPYLDVASSVEFARRWRRSA
jgi:uncharacterized protein (DUF58 family)